MAGFNISGTELSCSDILLASLEFGNNMLNIKRIYVRHFCYNGKCENSWQRFETGVQVNPTGSLNTYSETLFLERHSVKSHNVPPESSRFTPPPKKKPLRLWSIGPCNPPFLSTHTHFPCSDSELYGLRSNSQRVSVLLAIPDSSGDTTPKHSKGSSTGTERGTFRGFETA
jgi:hypothetical protein